MSYRSLLRVSDGLGMFGKVLRLGDINLEVALALLVLLLVLGGVHLLLQLQLNPLVLLLLVVLLLYKRRQDGHLVLHRVLFGVQQVVREPLLLLWRLPCRT